MLYFILWVVFLVGVLAAFFATMMMGKPKRPKAAAPAAAPIDDAPAEEAAAEPSFEEVAAPAEQAADDFAAFDEEFK
jgi:hypothetical protein